MTLVQELITTKNRIGLVSGSLTVNEYDDLEENVAARIDPKGWNIEISVKKGFDPITDRRQKAYAKKKKITDGKRTLLEDLLHHELAHWELPFGSGYGCPFDTYHHDIILSAVKDALPHDKQEHASYVANAFEDMMINPRVKEFKSDFSGQVLFWDDQGIQTKAKGQKGYTPFYEAFVKLNLHLFGNKADTALLKRHYTHAKAIDEAVEQVIKELNLPEGIQDTSPLFMKEQWKIRAEQFARAIAPLLETRPTEKLSAFSQKSEGSPSPQQPAGNGIEQKMYTKDGREQVAYGRYAKDQEISPNLQSHDQLDALYQKLARAIPVRVEALTREQGLSIAPLTFKPFDEDTDDMRKIKPTKIYMTEEGIVPAVQHLPLVIAAKSKIQRHSFPDFKMVMIDNSGSMEHAPGCSGCNGTCNGSSTFIPWGDQSKYHYALLGMYGIEQFLQQQGIAQYIHHGLSLFSSETRYQESTFTDLQKLRRMALSPEFGSTHIGIETLTAALQGKNAFVLSISDGEIENWSGVREQFGSLARQNYFAHIQVGSSNTFTSDLEKWHVPVLYVASGDQLSHLMVDITKEAYKKEVPQ